MTPIKRSRRLQAGLAGLSVVSALGAALGLGLTTHTGSQAQGSTGTTGQRGARTHDGGDETESNSGSGSSQHSTQQSNGQSNGQSTQQSSPVSPPANSAPQATTSGS